MFKAGDFVKRRPEAGRSYNWDTLCVHLGKRDPIIRVESTFGVKNINFRVGNLTFDSVNFVLAERPPLDLNKWIEK